jgi:tartrate-resistant acid phosphatase type 5
MKKFVGLTLSFLVGVLLFTFILSFLNSQNTTPSSFINQDVSGFSIPASAPAQSSSVKIAVVGDFGDPSPSPADAVATLVASWGVDAVVTTGDNNYPNGAMEDFATNTYSHYSQFIDIHKFLTTLGNHDWGYPDSNSYTADTLPSSQYFSYLPGNRRYYSVVLGNGLMKIIVLDTDRREPDLASQGQWLQNELSTSEIFKLVFTHEPPFSSCKESKNTDRSNFPYKEWGATLLLSGHCHLYERLEFDGFTYIVNGAGGGGQVDSFVTELSESRFQSQSRGAVLIEADSTKITVSFYDVSGNLLDQFTIDAGSQQAR